MLTKKQKRSIDQLSQIFESFYSKTRTKAPYADSGQALIASAILTQVYFVCHEADGSSCGEITSYELDLSEIDHDNE